MRADRLLSIVWLLRAHGRLTAAALAERLEVSRRTILRDVDALSASGVPVYSERGPHGGITLLPGYRTDVTALSEEESRALFAAVTPWGAEAMGLGGPLASGLRKLLAAVPEAHRDAAAQLASRVVVDPEGWLPASEHDRFGEVFPVVQQAVLAQHRLRLVYRRAGRGSTRTATVDPHGLVGAGRDWYLLASFPDDRRFLRISRVEHAAVLPDPVPGSAPVDVRAEWTAHRDRFRSRFTTLTAHLWVRDTRWAELRELTLRATEAPPSGPPPEADGWTFHTVELVDLLHARTVLLRLGPDALAVAPDEVREDLVRHLHATLDGYA